MRETVVECMAVLIEWRRASHPELKAGLRIDGQDARVACHDGRTALHPVTYHVIFHKFVWLA
jgi:hypothetical protein